MHAMKVPIILVYTALSTIHSSGFASFRKSFRVSRSVDNFSRWENPSTNVASLGASVKENEVETQKESIIDNFISRLSSPELSARQWRIVVIGNGAILETTSSLGKMKMGASPKTGERLVTFSSEDKSFEFHLKIDQVAKISLTSRTRPDQSEMRIVRMINKDSAPICSLILQGEDTAWWMKLQHDFGDDISL